MKIYNINLQNYIIRNTEKIHQKNIQMVCSINPIIFGN